MNQKIYQLDTFTKTLFSGNPAAVCPLDHWLDEEAMQQIAMENNLAETAFYIKQGDEFHIRWFTPAVEVDLCGHATLASAYVLFNYENHPGNTVHFHSSRSGKLTVSRNGDLLTLNFPVDRTEQIPLSEEIMNAFNITPRVAFKGKTDLMLVFDNENEIRNLVPDLAAISTIPARGVIVTAKGDKVDFVSRFFAPQSGIDEDPVTGSAHTTLIPYWAKHLGKTELTAMQLSKRTGYLHCNYLNDRVEIGGQCKPYLIGEIFVRQ